MKPFVLRLVSSPMKQKVIIGVFVGVAMLASAGTLAASDLWLHVRVDEDNNHPTRVRVNLPFSLIERALPLIPDLDQHHHGRRSRHDRIVISGDEIDVTELREMLAELDAAEDGQRFQFEAEWEIITYHKEEGLLKLEVRDLDRSDDLSRVTVPLGLAQAFAAREDQIVDFREISRWLVDQGEGEILFVQDEKTKVRVWVDDSPSAESWGER